MSDSLVGLPEQTAESLARLNYYQFLGLSESSSTEDVQRALHRDRWPWHLVDEAARQVATRMKVEAFGTLSQPWSRAKYDREKGFTSRHLAAAIGDDQSSWATAWVAGWSVLAVMAFVSGPVFAARIVGKLFAPGFDEIAVYHPPAGTCLNCTGYYARDFVSSNGIFDWLLDSLFMWVLFPAGALTIGMTLRTFAARACGLAVATSRRYVGDAWPRLLCFCTMIGVPLATFIAIVIFAPAGIDLPSER